jgi:2'-hydroxyisoflavone reductase
MTTRREFLTKSAAMAAGGVVAASGLASGARADALNRWIAPSRDQERKAAATLSILILGGTGFLGPAVIDAAQARGHKVTIFNRGRREKYVGTRDNIEKLYGNRDPEKHADEEKNEGPKGLEELKGKKFDAVVDTSGYVPRIVKASAELLAPNVGQYLFISTLSVYATNDAKNADESDPVGVMTDPTVESMGASSENYGPLKALCEQAAEAAMPGRVTNLRPGYIVGPGDPTDRFTYWPVRVSRGGEVLVPGTPDDAVQIIDVRDLAEFAVHCLETKAVGVMNACGPKDTLTNGHVLAACVSASSGVRKEKRAAEPTLTYVPYAWLAQNDVPLGTLPILLPPDGETAGFHTRANAKAVKAGLKFRTVDDTCAALIAWWPKAVELRTKVLKQQTEDNAKAGKPAPRMPAEPDALRAGIPQSAETEILTKWKAAEKK